MRRLWLAFARSSDSLNTPVMQTLRWLRIPGDTLFALGAVVLVNFIAQIRPPAATTA